MLKITYKYLDIDGLSPGERRRAEHDGALELLREGLASLGILNPVIKIGDGGKPYLENSFLHFNLSHSDGFCVCAISDEPVGIDAEAVRPKPPESILRIAKRMFTEQEQRILDDCGHSVEAFFEIWVKKEAIVKRSGVGMVGMRRADSCTEKVRCVRLGSFILAVCAESEESILPTEVSDISSHKKSGF